MFITYHSEIVSCDRKRDIDSSIVKAIINYICSGEWNLVKVTSLETKYLCN